MSSPTESSVLSRTELPPPRPTMYARVCPAVAAAPRAVPTPPSPPHPSAVAFAYLLGWVTGLPLLASTHGASPLRFHAAQSVVANGGAMLAFVAVRLVSPFGPIAWAAAIGMIFVWAYALRRALQGRSFRLPVAAPYADRLVEALQGPRRGVLLGVLACVLLAASFAPSLFARPSHAFPGAPLLGAPATPPVTTPVQADNASVKGLLPDTVGGWTRQGGAEVTRVRSALGAEIVHARATYVSGDRRLRLVLWGGPATVAPFVGAFGVEIETDDLHVRPIHHGGCPGMEKLDRKHSEVAVSLQAGKFAVSAELKGTTDPGELYAFLETLDLSAIAHIE